MGRLQNIFFILNLTLGFLFEPVLGQETKGPPICKEKLSKLGELNGRVLNEISGLAISQKFSDRFYAINDSGNPASFHMGNLKDFKTKEISLVERENRDYEDLTLGPCPTSEESCLYIADIGDNYAKRKSINLIIVNEEEEYKDSKAKSIEIELIYPDGPHDAEAMTYDPIKDRFLILTKAHKKHAKDKKTNAKLFAIERERIGHNLGSTHVLSLLTQFNFKSIATDRKNKELLVTGMDYDKNSKQLFILTYSDIFTVKIEQMVDEWQQNLVRHKLEFLDQQEAIAIDQNNHKVILSSETFVMNPEVFEFVCDFP